MRKLEFGESLQVGDVIETKHIFGGDNKFKITRITKRHALSKRESDGYEHKFKLYCSVDMAVPSVRYNMVRYSVFRSEE